MSFVTVAEEHVFNYPSLLVKEIHKQLITKIPELECPLVFSGAYYAFNMAYPKGLSSLFTIILRSHYALELNRTEPEQNQTSNCIVTELCMNPFTLHCVYHARETFIKAC